MKRRHHPDRETPQADGPASARPRPGSREPAEQRGSALTSLQNAAGNHAVQRWLRPAGIEQQHRYHHSWLILGNRSGVRRAWFQVY
jgi:hypothetical protein